MIPYCRGERPPLQPGEEVEFQTTQEHKPSLGQGKIIDSINGFIKNNEPKVCLLYGITGSGKTTLSIALLREGFRFLGDDRTFIRKEDDEVKLLAFPDELDVTEETILLFPEMKALPENAFKMGLRKRKFRVERVYPDSVADTAVPNRFNGVGSAS
jgi:primosomal protein N'